MPQSLKPHAPACDRNREPILAVLRRHFTDRRRVLEIGSGTGQHAVHFAAALPGLSWQTSDIEENLPGIRLWLEEVRLANLPAPLSLDVNGAWPQRGYDAVFSANTLHIMSWSDVRALFEHLQPVLESDACVAIYGPFNYAGRFTSPSNADFDAWLKQRSPLMGIRDFEAVDALAQSIGLRLIEDCAMPANNRTLVWRREAPVARPAG
jgi:cyclopropane fatty-acyl-phospholipid synthase-like methyltransferase